MHTIPMPRQSVETSPRPLRGPRCPSQRHWQAYLQARDLIRHLKRHAMQASGTQPPSAPPRA